MTQGMKHEDLADKIAVQEVVARIAYASDSGEIHEYLDCFTDDGVLQIPAQPEHRGRVALEARLHSVRDVGRFEEGWLMRRFSMRPGLTCQWQITGRSHRGFDAWVGLDLEYIDNWSLRLDCLILLKTIPAVLRGTGAQ